MYIHTHTPPHSHAYYRRGLPLLSCLEGSMFSGNVLSFFHLSFILLSLFVIYISFSLPLSSSVPSSALASGKKGLEANYNAIFYKRCVLLEGIWDVCTSLGGVANLVVCNEVEGGEGRQVRLRSIKNTPWVNIACVRNN